MTTAAAGAASGAATTAAAAAPAAGRRTPAAGPYDVTSADQQYADLVRGNNQRWVGSPDYVRLVTSPAQTVAAVQSALDAGKRVAVRSGGHCYEPWVSDGIEAVIDLSQMNGVSFDGARRLFVVEAGATLVEIYEALYKRWGVTLPGGTCPSVGAGGHVAGGGYGALSRRYGLIVDHLYGVEVVVVDSAGKARLVTATRDSQGAEHDLWWAHTGGGGGNFGVVTRYLFRSPSATGSQPHELLPKPPTTQLVSSVSWSWDDLTEQSFGRIMKNYGSWCEDNSAGSSPYAGLFSQLKPAPKAAGSFSLTTEIDASLPGAGRLLDDFLAAVNKGTEISFSVDQRRTIPWLHGVEWPGFTGGGDPTNRFKGKSAYMRKTFTDAHVAAFYRHLTRPDYAYPGALVLISSYGGAINSVAPTATAVPARDSVMKLMYVNFWSDPAQDSFHLAWMREFYRDVYAGTGGVPVPGPVNDGCFVNYADGDLSDPQWNTSGVPWHDLYYGENFPRLQRAKAAWDPTNVFHHAQSIPLPA
ncbi:FAD-binding oxidoreductase [Streptomyces sp. NRRL F-5126]|uniref:FAD-binding oxidoreductase n=1 Tax=Streptomyces sp. NRRL F-5126 TaxID=1463857 RepID=UPI002D21CF6A|nr:FAD-binding oxidoreductase [Streptomyces sp. NRRL F-5126]